MPSSAFRPLPRIAEGDEDVVDRLEDGTVVDTTLARDHPSAWKTMFRAGVATGGLFLVACAAVVMLRPGRVAESSPSSARLSDAVSAAWDSESASGDFFSADRLVLLGKGFCHNHLGNKFEGLDSADGSAWTKGAKLSEEGVSEDGETKCLDDEDCTGVATMMPDKYALITKDTKDVGDKKMPPMTSFILGKESLAWKAYPAWADGEEKGARCFWRQTFRKNSKDVYPPPDPKPVPKILWTFWQNEDDGDASLPPLVEYCMESWKQLNEKDGWKIRLLDEKEKLKWISQDDLPEDYDKHMIQHRADLVRLAVLNKHGGVWMDATTCHLKPMSEILGDDPHVRTFMTLKDFRTYDFREDRVGSDMFIENWMLATPAEDPLFETVTKCVWELQHLMLGNKKHFTQIGKFNDVEVEWLNSLFISEIDSYVDNYLSTHACFMKEISEDEALWNWYHSSDVRRLDAEKAAFHLYDVTGWGGQHDKELGQRLFQTQKDAELYEAMTQPDSVMMMKLPGLLRRSMEDAGTRLTLHDLWCKESTISNIVSFYGLKAPLDCGEDSKTA